LTEAIHHDENKDNRILTLMKCIPRILHMENRVGIKIIQVLLYEGITNAGLKNTYKHLDSKDDHIAKFVKDVETICNKEVLGCPDFPSQWHVACANGWK
jgi:hypothetical protein